MKTLKQQLAKYGDWALVAGAAEGLGLAFSKTIAACGKNVIMIDRNADKLQQAASSLEDQFGITTESIVVDLAKNDALELLMDSIRGRQCRLVVYNAAYGPVKSFTTNSEEEIDRYIDLNCRQLIKLAWAFSKEIASDQNYGFLAMSSLAGLRGTQFVAPYAASKAFTWNLMESLHYELKEHGVDFSAMCAGPIATKAFLESGFQKTAFTPTPQAPEFVAEQALKLLGKTAVATSGISNKMSNFFLTRLIPRRWSGRLTNGVMKKMYDQ